MDTIWKKLTKTMVFVVAVWGTIFSLSGLLTLAGCCDNLGLKLFRISGFFGGVTSTLDDVEFDALVSFEIQGSVGDWAGIPLVDEQQLNVTTADFAHYDGEIHRDIDNDGKKETVKILAAVEQTASETVYFYLAWEGDRYTLDSGRCYLGYTEGEETIIRASECDSHRGTMICSDNGEEGTSPLCQKCSASWECSPCNLKRTFDKCVPEEPSSGSADIDIDIDVDIDIDF